MIFTIKELFFLRLKGPKDTHNPFADKSEKLKFIIDGIYYISYNDYIILLLVTNSVYCWLFQRRFYNTYFNVV